MSRLKTVGFEQNTLDDDSEVFFANGDPQLVTNIDANSGQVALWDDLLEVWDSQDVMWPLPSSAGTARFEPENVRSGNFALRLLSTVRQYIYVRASIKGGGGYFRGYVKFPELPNGTSNIMCLLSENDDINRCSLEMQSDGRLRVLYRPNNSPDIFVSDNFDDNDLDPEVWNNWGTPQIENTGGQLEMSILPTANYYGIESTLTSHMLGRYAAVRIVDTGDQGLTTYEFYPVILEATNTDRVYWVVTGGNLKAVKRIFGTATDLFSVAYDSDDHKRVRIREASGDLYFEVSAATSGTDNWTTLHTVSNPINMISGVKFIMQVGNYDNEATGTTAIVDDVFVGADSGGVTTEEYIGDYSNPLEPGRYYALELAVFGNEEGATRLIEARVDHIRFMQQEVDDLESFDGYLAFGPNFEETDTNDSLTIYVDDVASNDGRGTNQNTWAGPGKCILLPVAGDDSLGNDGWTRGGIDTGADWSQISAATPPTDGESYLIGTTIGQRADFALGNPYERGLKLEDTINCIAINARWALSAATEGADVLLYLRAGSNLIREGNDLFMFGTNWFTGNAVGRSPDVYSSGLLPASSLPWTVEDLASARIGFEVINQTPNIYITAVWAYVDYAPYEKPLEYSLEINGVDRTADLEFQTLSINDQLNEQTNSADFVMYNLHDLGVPETDDEVVVKLNGIKLFSGFVLKVSYNQIGNLNDKYSISCVDNTRILDRRLVSATYSDMTDKEIIESIINEFAVDEGIGTYYVAEGVTIVQISFNYIPVSQALKEIAQLTARSWYIDYNRQIHYFLPKESNAPFSVTSIGQFHKNFRLSKDSSRVRNRVFVRGGTELTTDPITESLVADGEQRVFLLAEKPHDIEVTVNAAPQTVGIKNVHDPAEYDWLMNFQEKYIEAGTGTTTPAEGDIVAVTYNYDVPILVSVEDSESIAENGVYEYAIVDSQITSTQQARDRATAELTDYANDIVDASYATYEPGIRSGQFQRVTMINKGVDEDYLINTVTLRSLGGGRFVYEIKLTNAKTMGIIKFLLELLQIDRRVGDIDPNEKVDQLFSLLETVDSFTDSLGIDSGGTTFIWAADSYVGEPPVNKLKWNLGQWS